MKTLVSAAMFAALTTTAIAEPITIFITGNRDESSSIGLPAAKTIISSEDIENSGASTVTDILRQQSFIQITDSSGVNGKGNIDMRGFGEFSSFNTAILLDGQKLNRAADQSSIDLNMFDLDQIERIEIIKGSAGVLYGHEAVGGVINIISKKNFNRKNSASVEVGSFGRHTEKASISDQLSQKTSLNLSLENSEAANYRNHNDSDLKKISLNIQNKNFLGDTRLSIQRIEDFWLNSGPLDSISDAQRIPTFSKAIYANDWYDKKGTSLKLTHAKNVNDQNNLIIDAFYNNEKTIANAYLASLSGPDNTSQRRESISLNPRVTSKLTKTTNLLTGFDYTYTDYTFSSSYGPMNIAQNIYAIYSVIDHQISDSISLNSGLRHSHMDYKHTGNTHASPLSQKNNDSQTVGNVGLTIKLTPNWDINLRADQNYRFALVDEHNNFLYSGSTSALKTQTGNSYEAALSFNDNDATAQIQAYSLRLNDELIYDGTNYLTTNFDKTERNGISISLNKKIDSSIDFNIGYDYLDAKVKKASVYTDYLGNQHDFTDKTIPLTAKHSAAAGIIWKYGNNVTNKINWKYIGERYVGADFLNSYQKLNSFSTFNFSTTAIRSGLEYSFKVNNIFNKKSVDTASLSGSTIGYYPNLERNYALNVKYTFE